MAETRSTVGVGGASTGAGAAQALATKAMSTTPQRLVRRSLDMTRMTQFLTTTGSTKTSSWPAPVTCTYSV